MRTNVKNFLHERSLKTEHIKEKKMNKTLLQLAIEDIETSNPTDERLPFLKEVVERPVILRHIDSHDKDREKILRLLNTVPDLYEEPERIVMALSLFEDEQHFIAEIEGPGYFTLAVVNPSTFKFKSITHPKPFLVLPQTGEVLTQGGFKRYVITRGEEYAPLAFDITLFMEEEPPEIVD